MALLDDLIDSVVSKVAGEQGNVISQFLKDNGGVSGLAQKFQSGGAGEVFASWVGTGDNKAIASDMINKILGSAQVQQIAQNLGLDSNQAADLLAKYLPQVIDKLTPDAQIEPNPQAQPPVA
ncbi:MAG: YidB family protein [Cyanobacteriota bacterium]|nr:YidB family protein [Cyanobacteriota bacterium]